MSKTEYNIDAYFDAVERNVLRKLEKNYPKEFKNFLIQLAQRLMGYVVTKTPTGKTGDLQKGWKVGKVYKKGYTYYIDVYNNMEYVDHVEHGHRQNVGQFVPAIGKRLKQPFVEGAHMMSLSMAQIEAEAPTEMKTWLNDYLETLKI